MTLIWLKKKKLLISELLRSRQCGHPEYQAPFGVIPK